MIADPYKVLGVPEDVSDADLKKAYREMSKRWHPDANPNDVERAEEKFKEVQEAYRQIVEARERGTSAYGAGPEAQYQSSADGAGPGYGYSEYGSFTGFDDFFSQWARYSDERRGSEETNEMRAARSYINSGYYQQAMTALGQVPEGARNARWYYYAGIASQGLGRNIDAMNFAKRAVDLDPENAEYMHFLSRLQNGGTWYQRRGETYTGGTGMPSSTWCLSMCMLNLLCNMCGGGCVWI